MPMKTIAFEGGEGSGKGTIIKALAKYLEEKGEKVIITREPGGTEIGEQIRAIILDSKNSKMTGKTEAMLFAACRSQLLDGFIHPILQENKDGYLLLDRYVYSSYVYQGVVKAVGIDIVKSINDTATEKWHPDIVFYLDLSPEVGLERIKKSNRETNRFDKEEMDFHYAVREGYLKVAKMMNFKIINADQTVEEVLRDVIKEIENQ
jgi:dTMP kinase